MTRATRQWRCVLASPTNAGGFPQGGNIDVGARQPVGRIEAEGVIRHHLYRWVTPSMNLPTILQKFCELFHGQTGLSNDRAQSAGFQVSPGMNRNSHRSCRVSRINKNVVTPDNPIDDKTRSRQCLDNTLTVDGRQPSTAHIRRPPLRDESRDEHRTEVPFPVPVDIPGLRGLPPRH